MCYQVFAETVYYLPQKRASRTNSHNIIGRNRLMVVPFISQSKVKAYAFLHRQINWKKL